MHAKCMQNVKAKKKEKVIDICMRRNQSYNTYNGTISERSSLVKFSVKIECAQRKEREYLVSARLFQRIYV